MPRPDNRQALEKLVRHAVSVSFAREMMQGLVGKHGQLTADHLGAIEDMLNIVRARVATLDRSKLLELAEAAGHEGISIPRKQREWMKAEDVSFWLAVRNRRARGDASSEHKASDDEARERKHKTVDRARTRYRRTDEFVKDILGVVGLDANTPFTRRS